MIAIDASALLLKTPTGVERYCRKLLEALREETANESVAIYASGDCPNDFVLPANWQWRRLGFWLPKGWTHLRFSIELFLNPPERLFIPAHEIPIGVRRTRTKVTVMVHDVAFLRDKRSYSLLGNWRQRFNLANVKRVASNIIVPTEAVRDDLITLANFDSDRITVIGEGPTVGGGRGLRIKNEELRIKGEDRGEEYLLFVGRIEYKKGVDILLAAYRKLREELNGEDRLRLPNLKLVGKDGFGAPEIRAAGSDLEGVEWLGYVSDSQLIKLYGGAEAFIFPSREEGFGLPILDAWEAGVPVVASDIKVFLELDNQSQAIAFFQSGSFTDLARVLKRIISDKSERMLLMDNGSLRVKDFSWQKAARQTFALVCR